MNSSPTAGWLWCRMFTNVDVPPRASSRIVVAVVIAVPGALATAIPAPVSTTAADAAAAMAPLPILLLMCSMLAPSRPSTCPDLPGRARAPGSDGLVSGQTAPTPAVGDNTSVRDAARPRITGMTRSSRRQAKLGAIGRCEAPWLLHGLLHSGP